MNTDMPAEDDFSDSVPNPYIGKVRRRVTAEITAAPDLKDVTVTDQEARTETIQHNAVYDWVNK